MRHFSYLFLIFCCVICVLIQCKQSDHQKVETLLAIDKEFSDYSYKNGTARSFLKYCAKNAVIVLDSSMPLVGYKAISQRYDTNQIENYSLTWEPVNGDIAESGDLGYTYGTYLVSSKDSLHKKLAEGCYVTVWKKDSIGDWKWILDTGTDGLSR
jgi:ketosteroid isomerase-like protein